MMATVKEKLWACNILPNQYMFCTKMSTSSRSSNENTKHVKNTCIFVMSCIDKKNYIAGVKLFFILLCMLVYQKTESVYVGGR